MNTIKSTAFVYIQWCTPGGPYNEPDANLWSMAFDKSGEFTVPEKACAVTAIYNEPMRWPQPLNVQPGDKLHVYIGSYSERDMG